MSMNRRERILVTLLVIVAVGALYINYLVLPKYDEYKANKDFLAQRQAVLEELQILAAGNNLENQEREVDEKSAQLDLVVPRGADLPLLYLDMLALVQNSAVALDSFDFGVPAKGDDAGFEGVAMNEIGIQANMIGTYSDLDKFIGLVYENERKLSVEAITYEATDDGIRAAVKLKSYAFLEDGESYSEAEEYDFLQGKTFGRNDPFTLGAQPAVDETEGTDTDVEQE
ncbi:hypothetical protein [Alkalibacter mobilis]|uniref:hypothetical protein n=1 Tax=Alkalibacter mobilis TaxID=2787712 RepID=UPI0018A01957|nr:hypothetical protein [Alkalibacter mobilis]MBF7095751.1 hypothetical protein [Alkalibacter mobilis]